MDMSQVTALLGDIQYFQGYAATGAQPPYVVNRPLVIDHEDLALDGNPIGWDFQFSLYCAGESVEASFNLALLAMGRLQGQRVGDSTLDTSMGYIGAQVEGHYESQLTVQIYQGGI